MEHRCPKCGSGNVCVGNFVLRCLACKWSYLNEYPCTVCGEPSQSAAGVWGKHYYGCAAHPVTQQLGVRDALRDAVRAHGERELSSDVGAGEGLAAVPVEFSDEVISAPILYGEVFEVVTLPRLRAGGADDATVDRVLDSDGLVIFACVLAAELLVLFGLVAACLLGWL